MTYCGTQRLTVSNHGEGVYAGSSLIVVRGDFDALLHLDPEDSMQIGIAQGRAYHAAALACYFGGFALRTNHDVAHGIDDKGQWHSGVLQQSWRIGGASAAELAALDAFQDDPGVHVVRASTVELYGENTLVPKGAKVYYQGIDDQAGPSTRYSQIEDYGNAR
jgi:hypothetical protein